MSQTLVNISICFRSVRVEYYLRYGYLCSPPLHCSDTRYMNNSHFGFVDLFQYYMVNQAVAPQTWQTCALYCGMLTSLSLRPTFLSLVSLAGRVALNDRLILELCVDVCTSRYTWV
jgi:hypothetical protein